MPAAPMCPPASTHDECLYLPRPASAIRPERRTDSQVSVLDIFSNKAGGSQNALLSAFAHQVPTEYIIRVRPIVGSRRGCRTLWFSRVRVLLRCVTLCGAIMTRRSPLRQLQVLPRARPAKSSWATCPTLFECLFQTKENAQRPHSLDLPCGNMNCNTGPRTRVLS